jgi:uncharacterized repeat protein (TIGR01451 family)
MGTDPSHYFGALPGINVEKTTNGSQDAFILVGEPVTWTYTVTNIGNVPLMTVTLTDSDSSVIPTLLSGDTNGDGSLDTGEIWVYVATSIAEIGPYSNTAWISASFEDDYRRQENVEDADDSGYFGINSLVILRKTTNGLPYETPPGPILQLGESVTWTYHITNTGNITLTTIELVDDVEGEITSCPEDTLGPWDSMQCQLQGIALAGQYTNTATVTGTHPAGSTVAHQDTSYYFGADPAITLQKYTNGEDADSPPGPFIEIGDVVTWTYVVSNTGNVPLDSINVNDDWLGSIDCPATSLEPDQYMVCEETGSATVGSYANLGTVNAEYLALMIPVSDSDASHYTGVLTTRIYMPFTIR